GLQVVCSLSSMFFFSSRRRHTRWPRDWSSDVCSSDLAVAVERPGIVVGGTAWAFARPDLEQRFDYLFVDEAGQVPLANAIAMGRSEERRVGKECRCGGGWGR